MLNTKETSEGLEKFDIELASFKSFVGITNTLVTISERFILLIGIVIFVYLGFSHSWEWKYLLLLPLIMLFAAKILYFLIYFPQYLSQVHFHYLLQNETDTKKILLYKKIDNIFYCVLSSVFVASTFSLFTANYELSTNPYLSIFACYAICVGSWNSISEDEIPDRIIPANFYYLGCFIITVFSLFYQPINFSLIFLMSFGFSLIGFFVNRYIFIGIWEALTEESIKEQGQNHC